MLCEVQEGRDRQELALTALKIGILSLKATRGTVDGVAILQEGDRLLGALEERLNKHRELMDEALGGTLRSYFDPATRRDDARRSTIHGNEFEQRVGEQLRPHCLQCRGRHVGCHFAQQGR